MMRLRSRSPRPNESARARPSSPRPRWGKIPRPSLGRADAGCRLQVPPSHRLRTRKPPTTYPRKVSLEPAMRARSRYLSRPSAMSRCRVATQFLGLSSSMRDRLQLGATVRISCK